MRPRSMHNMRQAIDYVVCLEFQDARNIVDVLGRHKESPVRIALPCGDDVEPNPYDKDLPGLQFL